MSGGRRRRGIGRWVPQRYVKRDYGLQDPTSLYECDLLARRLADRVLIADGAMGTMLQAADPTLDDFAGHEGCNEILNVTRPDVVARVHDAYFAAGADCVETNTFGANLANLGEYGIADRIRELSRGSAPGSPARSPTRWSTPDRPRFVLGSMGPGTKLPTLGHAPYATLRDAYHENAAGLIAGGADALIVETCQDLLQAEGGRPRRARGRWRRPGSRCH